ncbi:hypothetical protein AAHK20_05475 [Trinickia sp. YCB016]
MAMLQVKSDESGGQAAVVDDVRVGDSTASGLNVAVFISPSVAGNSLNHFQAML